MRPQFGIGPRQRGLHQGRVGNGARHAVSIQGRPRPHHFHGNQLGGALAVTRDHAREGLAQQGQSLRKPGAAVVSGNHSDFRKAAGQRHDRVVGGGVTVNGDAIEGISAAARSRLCNMRSPMEASVVMKRKHGRHARMNHSRPFGNASDVHGLALCFRPHHASLGEGVSGHDGVGQLPGHSRGRAYLSNGGVVEE